MGLCKCPKKKVTNLFCFEHRVNVCEHCLVSNHPKCIVQSYLQWLQDSDYDPTCRLCSLPLTDERQGECVRLICYDVFHWRCLDRYARTLPANTAPAGYTCPACQAGVFPASNVVSPVAESLRRPLTQVNWARAGLGMPLIDEPQVETAAAPPPNNATNAASNSHIPQPSGGAPPAYSTPSQNHAAAAAAQQQHVVTVSDPTPYARGAEKTDFNPRRLFDTTETTDPLLSVSHDHDEDKYKRRPAMQWFSRWLGSATGSSKQKKKDPNASMKRFAVVTVLGLIAFFTMLLIFSRLGKQATDDDPFLDPMANPNIRVAGN